MSRVGQKPVELPGGVSARVDGRVVTVKGPVGELGMTLPAPVEARLKDNRLELTRAGDTREARRLHGLSRSLVANMVAGVSKGFAKELELQGVGFRVAVQGSKLTLSLGFSAPVVYVAPGGITISVKENIITISGPDKKNVGEVAARIRSFYPPEPYKGKGIRYRGEYVRRKAGKTVA
jgi:large subunit ribosomal protein L6